MFFFPVLCVWQSCVAVAVLAAVFSGARRVVDLIIVFMTLVCVVAGVGSSPILAPGAVFIGPAQPLILCVSSPTTADAAGLLVGSVVAAAFHHRLVQNWHRLLLASVEFFCKNQTS